MSDPTPAEEPAPILIADDDSFIRVLMQKQLQATGSAIIEASLGDEVLALYKKHRPRVVFLDVHIPNRNGFDVLQDILQEDPNACVVMISSDAVKANVVRSIQSGAKGFIGKPFEQDVLLRYLNHCATILPAKDAELSA